VSGFPWHTPCVRETPTGIAADHAALDSALDTMEIQRLFAAAILDSVDVGLVLLDHDGTYLTMNKRQQDFIGLAFPDGHAGRAGQLGAVYATDGTTLLTRQEMPTVRALLDEEFDDITIWVGSDPQTRRALSVSARSVRDENGAFMGAALAYKDVTDFMMAMKVKDDFIASVSHEFRTPLTSIIGYVSMMLNDDEPLPASQARHVQVVARNADRLHRLVSDLLLTAQPDSVPLEVVLTSTDVSAIVRGAVESAQPAAWARGVELRFRTPGPLWLMVDPQRFSQVVDNLISNAIKYSPQGGPVEVELSSNDGLLVLTVRDNGIGMSREDMDRLFTRFFRARDAEELSIQGVGLGLSIVKRIVDSHGGRVVTESRYGEGSTFRVELPVESVDAADGMPVEELDSVRSA
jgi:two-component system phosphate regulon sensor histidine kinase PhoR